MKTYTTQEIVNRIILGLVIIILLLMVGSAFLGMAWMAFKSAKFIIVILLLVFALYNVGDLLS